MPEPIPLYKGSLTNLINGELRSFSLNPSDIKDNKGHTYAEDSIPGISDPVAQSGHGGKRLVSFTLRLDADVGYRDRRSQNGSNDPAAEDINEVRGLPYSVKDEINWYRHFLYTEGNSMLGEADAQTPLILFDYGEFYSAFRCRMETCNVTITHFTHDLRPKRADLEITLAQSIRTSINRSSVYTSGPRSIF